MHNLHICIALYALPRAGKSTSSWNHLAVCSVRPLAALVWDFKRRIHSHQAKITSNFPLTPTYCSTVKLTLSKYSIQFFNPIGLSICAEYPIKEAYIWTTNVFPQISAINGEEPHKGGTKVELTPPVTPVKQRTQSTPERSRTAPTGAPHILKRPPSRNGAGSPREYLINLYILPVIDWMYTKSTSFSWCCKLKTILCVSSFRRLSHSIFNSQKFGIALRLLWLSNAVM